MDNRPIGIFDSGVGGLTVFKEIARAIPSESLIYFGDTLRFPYGPRDLKDVRRLAFNIAEFLIRNDVKMIVVACNTSTAAALKPLQDRFSLPVVGVIEPGARAAAQSTRRGVVGVMATQGTVASGAYEKALKKINNDIKVYQVPAPRLVEYVEKNVLKCRELTEDILKYIKPLSDNNIDVLILGCTHFPLIEDEIKSCCMNGVKVISSAVETAKDVSRILSEKNLNASSSNIPGRVFCQTGNSDKFLDVAGIFMGNSIKEVKKVNIDI